MMTRYLFIYHGGRMPETESEGATVMQAWRDWLAEMGDNVFDPGNPVGQSCTVHSGGVVDDHGGSNPTSGYSVIGANDVAQAVEFASSCPILTAGGSVEVAPVFEM